MRDLSREQLLAELRTLRPEFERELSRLGVNASFRDVEVRLPGERRASVVGVAWIPGEPQHV